MKLLLATKNPDKIREIKALLKGLDLEFLTLVQVAPKLIITEKGKTLTANARHKALTALRITKLPSLAEDTGLEVKALACKPGIYSARYAGLNARYEDNVKKLLQAMAHIPSPQRRARFRTVFALAIPGKKVYFFQGTCFGKITAEAKGRMGFGYDPVFVPNGYRKTFAEMKEKTKNRISHRAKALKKVKRFLLKLIKNA